VKSISKNSRLWLIISRKEPSMTMIPMRKKKLFRLDWTRKLTETNSLTIKKLPQESPELILKKLWAPNSTVPCKNKLKISWKTNIAQSLKETKNLNSKTLDYQSTTNQTSVKATPREVSLTNSETINRPKEIWCCKSKVSKDKIIN